ncbi:MAG: tRNA lysidine(34) synthetase TilS, partial [Calditrichia bacterium]|nr:tRNA lysidine(34) synthetase TilS [Calditrichia bacterium]
GHHQDDFAETVLMHLLEGSGLSGMAGIRLKNNKLIRPLLFFRKSSILEYCAKNSLPFAIDETNTNLKYKRNKIRHKLLPLLEKEFQPAIVKKLFQTGMIVQNEEKALKNRIENFELKRELNYVAVNKKDLIKLSSWELKMFFEEIIFPKMDIAKTPGFNQFEDLYRYINSDEIKKMTIADGCFIKNEKEKVVFFKNKTWESVTISYDKHQSLMKEINELDLKIETIIHTEKEKINEIVNKINSIKKIKKIKNMENRVFNNSLYLNIDTDAYPLYIMPLETEDSFIPLGLKYPVKVKRYLKEKGVSEAVIEIFPVIKNKNNEIIGIPGFMPDKKYKIKENNNEIFEIKFFNLQNFLV